MRARLPLPALLAALGLAACDPGPTEVEVYRAFVRRSGPTLDTVRVGRADTLALTATLSLLRGRAAWALRDPDGAVVWEGAPALDTTAAWHTADPARGDWVLEVRPEGAVGTFEARGRAW